MVGQALSCIAVAIAVWIGASSAAANCVAAPERATYASASEPVDPEMAAESGPTRTDGLDRVVAPVMVNGRGPYRFVVDTGANRSAMTERLAAELGLLPTATGQVHNFYGVSEAPLITVDRLQYGDVPLLGDTLPLVRSEVLAGEHGLLGVDGMGGRRLRIDFERNCIEIAPSRAAPPLRGWIELRGRMRFGHLVIIDGTIAGVRTKVFLDTGSNATLANVALSDAIAARYGRNLSHADSVVAYTAGRPVVLDRVMVIPRLSFGAADVRRITAYVGDFHIFSLWELTEEPTLLVGMDVLAQAGGLAIDYGRGRVYIRLRSTSAYRRDAFERSLD